jgi:hypothetical protein
MLKFALTFSAIGIFACGSGGGGDEAPVVKGSVLGDGTKISFLTNPQNPRSNQNKIVNITGARVVFVDNFDETGSGNAGNIYIQDFTNSSGPYEGIVIYQPSFSPPSFRTTLGDVIDARGVYSDFHPPTRKDDPNWLIPELVGPSVGLRFDAPYIPLVPVEIDANDLVSYSSGRQWMSMLVTVKNVKVFDELFVKDGRASITLQGPSGVGTDYFVTITNELFDLVNSGISPKEGDVISSVTGIVTMFGQFHIAPRSADDITLKLKLEEKNEKRYQQNPHRFARRSLCLFGRGRCRRHFSSKRTWVCRSSQSSGGDSLRYCGGDRWLCARVFRFFRVVRLYNGYV